MMTGRTIRIDAHRTLRSTSRAIATSALLCLLAGSLAAQDASDVGEAPDAPASRPDPAQRSGGAFLPPGSPYLPLGHWAYDYIDILVSRGKLPDLQPLVQPYRRADIAAAIRAAESEGVLSPVEEEWVDGIRRELRSELATLAGARGEELDVNFEFGAGLKARTHTHRDPLRPEGPERLWPTGQLHWYGGAPALAGAFRAPWDWHYLDDPQFPDDRAIERRACDPLVDECAYRIEDAYVEVQVPYVRVFFGRLSRNWGLPGRPGIQLSDYAYSYDHLGYRFGNERIALIGLFTPFNDFEGDTARFFSSHRLDWRIRDNLSVSVGESVVWGGVNRRVDFNLVNPVGVWEISGSSAGGERNSMGFVEAWWRPFNGLLGYGSFMVDNTSVGDQAQGRSQGINQYALALGVQLPELTPRLALRADLSIVSALAYRSRVAFFEYYALDDIGLARDVTDAIDVEVVADWYLARGLLLKPGVQLRWKGEDDLSDPFPPTDEAFGDRNKLLVGEVETTVRPVLGGRWHFPRTDAPWRGLTLDLEWDLGVNVVKDRDHEPADWDADLVGSLWFRVRQAF